MKKQFAKSLHYGFSMTELMLIIVVIGILGSISLPIAIKMIQKERLRIALTEMTSFIQNVRQNAMLHSTSCVIEITETGEIKAAEASIQATTNYCTPLNGTESSSLINLRHLSSDNTIRTELNSCSSSNCMLGFGFKGTSLSSEDRTIYIKSEALIDSIMCATITSPIGFVKIGRGKSVDTGCIYTSAM